MSQPARLTSGTGPVADDSRSRCTFTTHASPQTPLQQTDNSTLSTSMTKTTMGEATPTSPPLSTVLNSPVLSAKDGVSHVQESPTSLQQSNPETNDGNPPTSSTTTLPGQSPVAALEKAEEGATKRQFKRARAEDDDEEDASPVPKKPARRAKMETEPVGETSPAKTKAPNETIADDSGIDAGELAKPKKPMEKWKPKPTSKRVVAKSCRRRACATCKRRKVKCKHNPAEEELGDESIAPKDLSLEGTMDEAEGTTKPVQKDEGDESMNSEASAPAQAVVQVDRANNYAASFEEEPRKKPKAKKKATPKKARAPPERTSTRNRKAPERFEDIEEKPLTKASPTKKGTSKVFDPVYITTNSTSRLGKADMYHMLTEDAAWTSLSAEQQATLVSMLPDTTETQQLLAKVRRGETEDTRPQYLKASDVFRTEVAKFQADLTNGHLAKTWQAAAEQAVIERAAGEYDAWKAEEAELWWGQKSN